MKKIFALVLAFVMALSLTTVAWGATVDEDALKTAAANGGTVTLDQNIALTSPVVIDAKEVTIEGNGFTISNANGDVFVIKNGGKLTLGAGLNVHSDTDCAVFFPNPSNGTLVSSANLSSASANYATIQGNGTTLHTGTSITINGGSVTSANSDAIYQPQAGTITINAGTVAGYASGIAMKSGTLTVAGGSVICTGPDTTPTTGYSNGVNASGAAIQIESSADYAGNVVVNVTSGTVKSTNGAAIYEYNAGNNSVTPTTDTTVDSVSVSGGDITGKIQISAELDTDDAVTVSGGTFTDDVSAYVADGYQLLANGTVVTTPAAGTPVPTLYVWNNATAKWDTYCIAFGMDMDDLKQDASDNCLPCYCVNGKYFIETTSAAATYKLTYGAAKVVYLAPVAKEDVHYDHKASVLKVVDDEDATCGDWYVADLDEDDVYYISYDKKGVVVEGVYVAAKNGPVQILVKGKIVDVKSLTQADIKQLPHDWKGYDVVDHEYTTVKCANCGKVATLYANGTAAGKDAVKVTDNGTVLGYITAAADSYTTAGSASTSTDKVTSAQTFDAGIAMYVGMSVMAAAGSAVVLKKREG